MNQNTTTQNKSATQQSNKNQQSSNQSQQPLGQSGLNSQQQQSNNSNLQNQQTGNQQNSQQQTGFQQQVNPPSTTQNQQQQQQKPVENQQQTTQPSQQQQGNDPNQAGGEQNQNGINNNNSQLQQQQNTQGSSPQKQLTPEEIKQKEMEDKYQEILNKKIQQLEEGESSDNNQNQSLGPPIIINTKCHIKGHQDEIMGICLKPNCEKKSRLVCFTCAIQNHSDHSQHIVRLSDMRQDQLFIRNWPTDKLAIDINNFLQLNSTKDILKQVDQIFDKFQKDFVKTFEKVKEQVKKDITEKLQKNDSKIKELEQQLNITFNLQAIKNNITDFNSQKIKQPEFESKIQIWLTGNNYQILKRELEDNFWEKKKSIKQQFSSNLLQSFLDKVLKILDEIPKSIWPKVM